MKIGFYSQFADQMNNRLFSNTNVASGIGDDLLLPFVRLGEEAARRGVNCQTVDMDEISAFDAFVFCEMPDTNNVYLRFAKKTGRPAFLIISENHFIAPMNREVSRYKDFNCVFTYDDSFIDHKHIIKLNYSFDLPRSINCSINNKQKLAVMITSNHKRDLKNLLYGARRETISWFEQFHPQDFDLYGRGWERGALAFQTWPRFQRLLRRIGVLRFFPTKKYSSWKGSVVRKRDVLGRYRFGFCYENTDKIPGYITEKIFDVMMSGTVPVYWGAENTGAHIPSDCFINRAAFKDHETLFRFLKEMTDEEYESYLQRINIFLSSSQSAPFSVSIFVDTLLSKLTINESLSHVAVKN